MVGIRSFIAGMGCLLCATSLCEAQFLPQRAESSEEVFLLAPRPLTRLLREGESAFQEMRYSDGITALFSLLLANDEELPADVRGQDYFVELGTRGLFNKSVKSEAIRLLSELPPEGRRTLEIQFGVTARRELTQAIESRDFEAIGDVARLFVHTEAGYDAQVLLAQYKLTSGHPLAAAGLLQNLLQYPAARQRYGPQLALVAARAWMLAGNQDAAGLTLKLAARDFPGESLDIAGTQHPLDVNTDWVAILARELEHEQPGVNLTAKNSWTMTGGAPERNAVSSVGMPLKTERWVREIHSSLPEQEAIVRQSNIEKQRGRVLLPKFELRMVGDLVLTKTTDASLLAIDFETGVIKWPLYFHNAPVQLTNMGYANSTIDNSLSTELQSRVWGSSAFGKFSCDQQRLYFVSNKTDQVLDAKTIFRANLSGTDSNFLEGASIQSQGAILWRVGGANGGDEPQLANAYFLGPPLPYEGDLYCLVEIRGETKLVVLDSANGRLRWMQQLVQSGGLVLRYDEERKSQALSPTIADGVILCPTGVGAVVAVDMLSRSLKWGAAYMTKRQLVGNVFRQRGAFGEGPDFSPLEQRWQEPGMIAQDGVVILTPPESDELFCRDILTGVPRITQQRRNSYRYVAGLREGAIVVVGEKQTIALELGSSRTLWHCEYPDGLVLAGKGIWQADKLLLPMSEQTILQIDTATGKILDRTEVAQPLGNLFAHRDQLLSVSSSAVTVYYTREPLQRQVSERLAANPRDPWALNQQSQLALAEGNLQLALDSLQLSYEINPESADTRFLLVELLLSGLQSDFARFEQLAQQYESIVELGPQQIRFLQQLALGKIRSGQHLAAFQRLLKLIPKMGTTFAVSQNRQRELSLSEGYTVDSDLWVATELQRAYSQAQPEEQQLMQQLIMQELATINNTMVPLRREKLRFLQWLPPARNALIELAQALLGGDEQTIAEQLLQPVLFDANEQVQAIARGLLKQPALSDLPDWNALTVAPSIQTPDSGNSPKATSPPSWNTGPMDVQYRLENLYTPGATLEVVSERFGRPELSVAISGSHVVVRSANGEDSAHLMFAGASADLPSDALTRAYVRGGLLFIEKSSEFAAFDLCRENSSGIDALLWRQSLFSPGAGPSLQYEISELTPFNTPFGLTLNYRKQTGFVGPITPSGVVMQVGTEVMLLDSLTGKKLWTRQGYDEKTRMTGRGLEVALINPSLGNVEVLDSRDGKRLRSREFRGDRVHLHSHNGWIIDYEEGQALPAPPPTVRIWNAFSGEVKLNCELEEGSRMDFCEGRYLVILEPSGRLRYCDFQSDFNDSRKLLLTSHETGHANQVDAISVLRFENRLAVLTHANKFGPQTFEHVSASGPVYAIDCETGELCWNSPGKLSDMQIPVSQPRQSPFMFAYRIREESRKKSIATIAFVDLRTGKLAYSNTALPVRANIGFSMVLHPEQQAIDLGIGSEIFTADGSYPSMRLSVTAAERPPQPIVSFGALPDPIATSPEQQRGFDKIFSP